MPSELVAAPETAVSRFRKNQERIHSYSDLDIVSEIRKANVMIGQKLLMRGALVYELRNRFEGRMGAGNSLGNMMKDLSKQVGVSVETLYKDVSIFEVFALDCGDDIEWCFEDLATINREFYDMALDSSKFDSPAASREFISQVYEARRHNPAFTPVDARVYIPAKPETDSTPKTISTGRVLAPGKDVHVDNLKSAAMDTPDAPEDDSDLTDDKTGLKEFFGDPPSDTSGSLDMPVEDTEPITHLDLEIQHIVGHLAVRYEKEPTDIVEALIVQAARECQEQSWISVPAQAVELLREVRDLGFENNTPELSTVEDDGGTILFLSKLWLSATKKQIAKRAADVNGAVPS